MKIKIFFIAEGLSAPFDEGFKNITFSLYNQLVKKENVLSVTKAGNNTDNLKVMKIGLNKLFLNGKLRRLIKDYLPDVILYLPEASVTFNSFIRAKVLKFMNRLSKVVVLGVQHREFSYIQSVIITNLLKPDLLLLLGKSDEDFFIKKGIKVKILPPAVDSLKFCSVTKKEKEKIRSEYDISHNKIVVLHVGHIRTSRNIECFLEIQKIENMQVIIVGSTSTNTEGDLKNRLLKAGIRVIDETLPDISEVYKMSDIYLFPVVKNTAAIDMPLSVLEALACNLPIITTRFGALVEYFEEDDGFKYFDTAEELVKLVRNMDNVEINNNKKVERFTWERFTDEILAACNECMADNSTTVYH